MDSVPAPLRDRLGPEATAGLLELLERQQRENRDDVISTCTDPFERRLVEELAGVRVQIAQTESTLRTEMAEMRSALRQEMAEMRSALRQEMAEMRSELRQEMTEMSGALRQQMVELGGAIRLEMAGQVGDLRQEISSGRFELLKWCFLFWAGQVLTISGIMGVMFRYFR